MIDMEQIKKGIRARDFFRAISGETITKIEVTAAVVMVLVLGGIMLGNPNITGFLSLDFVMQDLNMTLAQSQGFILTSLDPTAVTLTSFKISGEIIGNGKVEAYIDNGQGQRLLIYQNIKPKERGMGVITGFLVAGEKDTELQKAEKKTYLVINPGEKIEYTSNLELSENQEPVSGVFSNECVETCYIKMELSDKILYHLIFLIEPGTTFRLNNIVYTLDVGDAQKQQ